MASGKQRRGTPFRASEVQRDYRRLLDLAKDGPVQILDSDGSALGIQPWEQLEFDRRLRELVSAVGQMRAAYERHRGEPVTGWAALTPFPWIDALHEDEVAEYVDDLIRLALAAAGSEDVTELEGCISAYRSTAATNRAPAILAAMLEEGEPVEVFPPSRYGFVEPE